MARATVRKACISKDAGPWGILEFCGDYAGDYGGEYGEMAWEIFQKLLLRY